MKRNDGMRQTFSPMKNPVMTLTFHSGLSFSGENPIARAKKI